MYNNEIRVSNISKYRTELMGFAILGVLAWHIMTYSGYKYLLLVQIAKSVYTHGFIFLSGFGLYFSFYKNPNVVNFYKKRLNRLYLPFVIMTAPFVIYKFIIGDYTASDVIFSLTTLKFWFEGNYFGMWYIAVTLFLYLIYPLLHKIQFRDNNKHVFLNTIFVVLLMVLSLYLLKLFIPYEWDLNSNWLNKVVMFPIGMFIGYCSSRNCVISKKMIVSWIVVIAVVLFLYYATHYKPLFEYARVFIGIPLVTIFISKYGQESRMGGVLNWLGTYSLEIYVLHMVIYFALKPELNTSGLVIILIAESIALLVSKPVHNLLAKIIKILV